MRIALVTDTFTPQVNGVTTVVRAMRDALAGAGHTVGVVAPRYPAARAGPGRQGSGDGEQGLTATTSTNLDNPHNLLSELRIPSVAFPPYPDIRLSVPHVRQVHRYLDGLAPDLVHVATEGPLGLIGRRYALRRRRPLVTSFHTDFPRYCRDYGVPALAPVVWRWLRWFHRPAAVTHTPGLAVRDELARRGIRHAQVWGRGVDTALFHPARRDAARRRDLGAPNGTVLVLHVGRLAPEKNVELLVAAWTLAREALGARAAFVVAGDGPMASHVEREAPWVRRLGFLDRQALASVYACADLCVLPSETETCGLVALEAMASGVPVIAADAGGLRESVRHGRDGLLVPPGDARGFAAAIVELAMEADRRRALGRAARAVAETRDARRELRELIELYRSLVHASAPEAACTAA